MAGPFEGKDIHEVPDLAAREQGAQLVGQDLFRRVYSDRAKFHFRLFPLRCSLMDEVHDNGFAPPADEPSSEIRGRLNVLDGGGNGFHGCLQRRLAIGQQVCRGEDKKKRGSR